MKVFRLTRTTAKTQANAPKTKGKLPHATIMQTRAHRAIFRTRTGGSDEGEQEVEPEQGQARGGLGFREEVQEAEVREQGEREQLGRDALRIDGRSPRIHRQQPPARDHSRPPPRPPPLLAGSLGLAPPGPAGLAAPEPREASRGRRRARERRRDEDGRRRALEE